MTKLCILKPDCTFFVCSADGSKKLVTVYAKHLSVPQRSFLVLSENGMVNKLWSYRL